MTIPRLYAYNESGEIKPGDKIKSFRDEEFTFIIVTSQGKIYAENESGTLRCEYFPSVFNLHIGVRD